jgi:hypothetical protein
MFILIGGQALTYCCGAGSHISNSSVSSGSGSRRRQWVIAAPGFGGLFSGPYRRGAGGAGTVWGGCIFGSVVRVGAVGVGRAVVSVCCEGCCLEYSPDAGEHGGEGAGGVVPVLVFFGWGFPGCWFGFGGVFGFCFVLSSRRACLISHIVSGAIHCSSLVRVSGSGTPHSIRSCCRVVVQLPIASSVSSHLVSHMGPNRSRLLFVGYFPGHHQGLRVYS